MWQEWEAQKQVNTPALCAKVLNNLIAGVRRDATAAPAIPRDGIMATRAAGMRFNALKHISRAKNSAEAAEGIGLMGSPAVTGRKLPSKTGSTTALDAKQAVDSLDAQELLASRGKHVENKFQRILVTLHVFFSLL